MSSFNHDVGLIGRSFFPAHLNMVVDDQRKSQTRLQALFLACAVSRSSITAWTVWSEPSQTQQESQSSTFSLIWGKGPLAGALPRWLQPYQLQHLQNPYIAKSFLFSLASHYAQFRFPHCSTGTCCCSSTSGPWIERDSAYRQTNRK